MPRPVSFLLWTQALYYVVTGLWPLVHLPSFEALTGPKTDDWLVHMVGLLAAVIGAVLALALRARRMTPETGLLSAGAAASFLAIDVRYALADRISDVYWLDALPEAAFVLAGLAAWRRAGRDRPLA